MLGTAEDSLANTSQKEDEDEASTSKKQTAENQFYQDSSTFLKVGLMNVFVNGIVNNK